MNEKPGMYELFGRAVDRCESPIERRLLVAFLFSERYTFRPIAGGEAFAQDALGIRLAQQVSIEDVRVDFTLCHPESRTRVVIECDGHDFHDGDRQQAQKDKGRDRRLVSLGWVVLRFTGRELHRDPLKCAQEAWRIAAANAGQAPKTPPIKEDTSQTSLPSAMPNHITARFVGATHEEAMLVLKEAQAYAENVMAERAKANSR